MRSRFIASADLHLEISDLTSAEFSLGGALPVECCVMTLQALPSTLAGKEGGGEV